MSDRSVRPARRRLAAALALALAAPHALAQPVRTLPENVEIGRLRIGVFPEATLDGRPVLLGAGLRIHDEDNRLALPVTVTGTRPIAYRRGPSGELMQAWLLTEAEFRELAQKAAAQRRAAGQAR